MIVTAYLSHAIRGKKGDEATERDMAINDAKAKTIGNWLCLAFPELELYVPGNHDEFVKIAYEKDYMTINQILDVDCDILLKRDLLIVYDHEDYISGGMRAEIDAAKMCDVPIITFYTIEDGILGRLHDAIDSIRRSR